MSTQFQLADHLGMTQPAVAELLRRGIIPKGAGRGGLDLDACRLAYIDHLREVAAGRSSSADGEFDLIRERARLAHGQADSQERLNLIADASVCEWGPLVEEFGRQLAMIRSRFMGLPSAIAERLFRSKTPAELQSRLYDAVCDVLAQLSAPEPSVAKNASQRSARAIAGADSVPATSTPPERS